MNQKMKSELLFYSMIVPNSITILIHVLKRLGFTISCGTCSPATVATVATMERQESTIKIYINDTVGYDTLCSTVPVLSIQTKHATVSHSTPKHSFLYKCNGVECSFYFKILKMITTIIVDKLIVVKLIVVHKKSN